MKCEQEAKLERSYVTSKEKQGLFSFFSKKSKKKHKKTPTPKATAPVSTADQVQHSSSTEISKNNETTGTDRAGMARSQDTDSSEETRQKILVDNELGEQHGGFSKLPASNSQGEEPVDVLNATKMSVGEDTSLKQNKPGQETALHNSTVEHTMHPREYPPKPATPTHLKQSRKGTPEARRQNWFPLEEDFRATSTTGQPMKRKQEAIPRMEVATANSTHSQDHLELAKKETPSSIEVQKQNFFPSEEHFGATSATGQSMKHEAITRVEEVAAANATSTIADTHQMGAEPARELENQTDDTLDGVEKQHDEDKERRKDDASKPKAASSGGIFRFFSKKNKKKPKQSSTPKAPVTTADHLQHSSSSKPLKSKETTGTSKPDTVRTQVVDSSKEARQELDEQHGGFSKLTASNRQEEEPLDVLNAPKMSGVEDTSLKQNKPGQETALHNSTVEHTKQPSEHLPQPATPTQPRDHSTQARKGTPSSSEAQKQNSFLSEEHFGATSTTGQSMKHKQEAITRVEAVTLDEVEKQHDERRKDDAGKQKSSSSGGMFRFFSKKNKKKPKQGSNPKASSVSTADQLQHSSSTKTFETAGTGRADAAKIQDIDSPRTKDIHYRTEQTKQQTVIQNPFQHDNGQKSAGVVVSSNATRHQISQQEYQRRHRLAIEEMEKSSGRALETLNDTYQIGVATVEELEKQEDVLDRVESRLDHMEVGLDKGAENVRELEKPVSWFSKKKKARKSPKPKPSEKPSTSGQSRVDPTAHNTFSTSHLHQYRSTGSEVVDRNLDEMSRQLEGLKAVGLHIGEQLDHTGAQLHRVQDKSGRSAFDNLKRDIARQL